MRLTGKERILLYLLEASRLDEGIEVPPQLTQEGVAWGTTLDRRHLPQYIHPLLREGLVRERRAHVRGIRQRRKVYGLTQSGKLAALHLRNRVLAETITIRKGGAIRDVKLSDLVKNSAGAPSLLGLVRATLRGSPVDIDEVFEASRSGLADFSHEAPPVERFVGREEELRRILDDLEATPIVVVTGVAGIGKSALGAMVCNGLRGKRSLFWRRIRTWDTAMDLAMRLAGFLRAQGRTVLYGYLSASGPKELGRIEELLVADLAQARSVLVFDDVHTANDDAMRFMSLLCQVLRLQKASCGLFLSRTVPSFYSRRDVEVERSVAEVPLAGLDSKEVQTLLRDAGLPASLVPTLSALSGGSPLFLKVLSRARVPEDVKASWRTVETYIAEEIESGLSDTEQRCLQVASLYELPVPAEGILLGAKRGIGVLVGLEKKGLLDRIGADRFVLHDFLRTYFQNGLTSTQRRKLVHQVVPWLLDEADGILKKGLPSEANPFVYWPHLIDYEHREVIQKAISLVENAIILDTVPGRRAFNYERLARLRYAIGDISGGNEADRTALRVATDDASRIRIHKRLADHSQDPEEAERQIEAGLELLPDGPSLDAGELLVLRAELAISKDNFEKAWEDVDLVASWRSGLPANHELFGYLALVTGALLIQDERRQNLPIAEAELGKALKILGAAKETYDVAWVYLNLAEATLLMGRPEDALTHLDQLLAAIHAAADPHAEAVVLCLKGRCLSEWLGDYKAAERHYGEAETLAGLFELPWKSYIRALLASVYEHEARYREARESLASFLREYRFAESTFREARVTGLAWMARLCLLCHDVEAAEEYLREAIAAGPKKGSAAAMGAVAWAEGMLLSRRGDVAHADARFQIALKHLEPPGAICAYAHAPALDRSLRSKGHLLLDYGRFLASIGEPARADEILGQARETFRAYGMKAMEREGAQVHESLAPQSERRFAP